VTGLGFRLNVQGLSVDGGLRCSFSSVGPEKAWRIAFRCRGQSRPDSGFGVQVEVLEMFQGAPFLMGNGRPEKGWRISEEALSCPLRRRTPPTQPHSSRERVSE